MTNTKYLNEKKCLEEYEKVLSQTGGAIDELDKNIDYIKFKFKKMSVPDIRSKILRDFSIVYPYCDADVLEKRLNKHGLYSGFRYIMIVFVLLLIVAEIFIFNNPMLNQSWTVILVASAVFAFPVFIASLLIGTSLILTNFRFYRIKYNGKTA